MELTLNYSIRVNTLANFRYFGKSCFIPKPSTLRFPNHDLFSSSNVASFKAGKGTWASSACKISYKKSIESVGKVKYKSSDVDNVDNEIDDDDNDPNDDADVTDATCDDDDGDVGDETDVNDGADDETNDTDDDNDVSDDADVTDATSDDDDDCETNRVDLCDSNSSLESLSQLIENQYPVVEQLSCLMSERGLIRLRVHVMVQWLLRLSRIPQVMKVTCLSKESQVFLVKLIEQVTRKDARKIKKIEQEMTEKDGVKAVELFLKEKCKSDPDMSKMFEFFNLSCTSEDNNNLVASLMTKEATKKIMVPVMDILLSDICGLAERTSRIPMASSGDSSSEQTTLGKEIVKAACRLGEAKRKVIEVEMLWTFAAKEFIEGLPTSTWVELEDIAKEFVRSLGITPYPCIPQTESNEYTVKILHSIFEFNSILSEFNKGMKGYIGSLDFFKQPNDIDRTDFDDSENNIEIANLWLDNLSKNVPFPQWGKDFSANSPSLRSLAMCFGHSLFAYADVQAGIEEVQASSEAKISINSLVEMLRGVMRMYEVPANSYKKLLELNENGKLRTRESITEFIEGLEIPSKTKTGLLEITLPHTCDDVLDQKALDKAEEEVKDLIRQARLLQL